MEAKAPSTLPPPASAPAVRSVLGSDNLLREILLRLEFPSCLVRAAAVCRCWLRHASDPAFLNRFRARHPPRLLGFYHTTKEFTRMEFVPLPSQPPELAAVLRRGYFNLPLDAEERSSLIGINGMYCHDGRLFFGLYYGGGKFTYGLYRPLHPERGIFVVPPPPMPQSRHDVIVRDVFAREESGDELTYFWFGFQCKKKGKATASLYILRDNTWCKQTSARTKIPGWPLSGQSLRSFLVIGHRVYLVATVNYILVFDWTCSSFSTMRFPDGVDDGETLLSRASDSGLYLVHLTGLKLRIWRRMTVDGHVGEWLLLDTICLHDLCADLRMPDCKKKDDACAASVVTLRDLGDDAEFVFLEIGTSVFYLDVRSKALHKCYEVEDGNVGWVRPFRMIWPPIFPALY